MPRMSYQREDATGQQHHSMPPDADFVPMRMLRPFINVKLIEVAELGDVHGLLELIRKHLPDMNLVNMATALHRLAKLSSENQAVWDMLRQPDVEGILEGLLMHITRDLQSHPSVMFSSRRQSLSNIIWSLGTMRCFYCPLVRTSIRLAQENLLSFKGYELVSTVWAAARLATLHEGTRVKAIPLLKAAIVPVGKVVHKLGLRHTAMAAWAFAVSGVANEVGKTGLCHLRLVLSLSATRVRELIDGKDIDVDVLHQLIVAFTTPNERPRELLEDLASHAARQIQTFSVFELLHLCTTFYSEGIVCKDFSDACEYRCRSEPMPHGVKAVLMRYIDHCRFEGNAATTRDGRNSMWPSSGSPSSQAQWSGTSSQMVAPPGGSSHTAVSSAGGSSQVPASASGSSQMGPLPAASDSSHSRFGEEVSARGPANGASDCSELDNNALQGPEPQDVPNSNGSAVKSAAAPPVVHLGKLVQRIKNLTLEFRVENDELEFAALRQRLSTPIAEALTVFTSKELDAYRIAYQMSRRL